MNDFREFNQLDVPLSELSYINIGGKASYIFSPESIEELQRLLPRLQGMNYLFLAGGTNILFPDYFEGAVITDQALPKELSVEKNFVTVSGNYVINTLIRKACDYSLGGLEFLGGVPAHIAGLVRMDAGAYGRSIGEFINSVKVICKDGSIRKYSKEELMFDYRGSSIEDYIFEVTLKMKRKTPESVKREVDFYIAKRRETQPLNAHSLGCFFKNPELPDGTRLSAGKLIDECNLKGLCVGEAFVSEKHANFIVNKGNAEFQDVHSLIDQIQYKITDKYGIKLDLEIIDASKNCKGTKCT